MQIAIGKLSLRLTGVPPDDAPRLAHLLADGLSRADTAGAYSVGSLTVHAGARPGERLERLADRIVAAVAAEVRR